jgi:hypothetical protein
MEVIRRLLVPAILLSVSFAHAPATAADDDPPPMIAEARTRYARGIQLYKEGSYDAALVEMQRAYDLAPSWKILFNLGLIHRELHDYAAALVAFRRYLDEGSKKVLAVRRIEVEKFIEALEARVARIRVVVDLPGAEITLDDAVVGTSPLADPIVVNVGKRKVGAKIAGRPSVARVVTVASRDAIGVEFRLGDEPEPVAARTKSIAVEPPPDRRVPWLAWGVTGGLAVAATTTGIIALGARAELDRRRDTPEVSRADLDDAHARTKTWGLVTDVLLVGTAGAAVVSTWLTLRKPTTEPRVQVGFGPGSIVAFGSF